MRKNLRLLRVLPVAACALALAACGKGNQQTYVIPEEASKIDVKKIDAGATALRLADAAYAKGDFNMAAQLYFRAAELQPENGTVMVRLGFALFKTGGAQDAEKIFRAALASEPKNADAMRGLAHSLVMQGKAGQALPLYRQAIAAAGQPDARIYAGLGAALDMVGKHDEARAAYAAGLKLAPDDFSLKNNLALSYAMSGDTAKARGILSDMSDDPAAPKKRESIAALQTTVAKAAVPPRKQPAATLVAKAPAEKPAAEKTLAERPGPVAGLAGEVREIAEATPRSNRPRGIQKAIADLPGADTIDGEIYIRTGRATVAQATAPAGAAPKMLAMSVKTAADTPEDEAAEVLELLAQAERGPRFVWQMARRPDAS
jgi:Flp pilus assembly protein TadD